MRRMVVGGVVLVGAIACGGKDAADGGGSSGSASTKATAVKDEGFSKTCATDTDCVLAELGDTCGICNFSNAAIAKSAQPSFQAAYNTAHNNCPQDHAVGKCAPRYGVSHCNESKVCTYVECPQSPSDEHHCTGTDGGH